MHEYQCECVGCYVFGAQRYACESVRDVVAQDRHLCLVIKFKSVYVYVAYPIVFPQFQSKLRNQSWLAEPCMGEKECDVNDPQVRLTLPRGLALRCAHCVASTPGLRLDAEDATAPPVLCGTHRRQSASALVPPQSKQHPMAQVLPAELLNYAHNKLEMDNGLVLY